MIRPCKTKHFLRNFEELNNFLSIPIGEISKINRNTLINIIRVYFESLLCYNRIHIGNHRVTINRETFIIESKGTDNGIKSIKGFDELAEILLRKVIKALSINIDIRPFTDLILLCNEIIETTNISVDHKIHLLSNEGEMFGQQWQYLLFELEEDLAIKSIDRRKDFVIKILTNENKYLGKKSSPDEIEKKLDSLYTSYGGLVRTAIRVFIYHNHFEQIFKYIYHEFELFHNIPEDIEIDDNKIISILLRHLISNNKLFLVEDNETIEQYYQDNYELLSGENKKAFKSDLEFELKDIELQNSSVELAEPSFDGIDQNEITTTITFTISGYDLREETQIQLKENVSLELKRITNLFDDPIFSFLDSLDIAINSFPFSVFSDVIGNTNNSIRISFVVSDFYHPDFNIVKNGIEKIDLSEHDAKIGRTYYPHKEYIVELLRGLKKAKGSLFPFEIELDKINIDLISNFYVSYHDSKSRRLYNKIFTITNLDSYFKVKERFLTKVSELNLNDESQDIRSLIFETEIINARLLNEFVIKLIQLVVKKSIELRGVNKNLWKESLPVKETEAQPIIFNLLKSIGEIKGIQVSREIEAANGSLDFHCSYTYNGKLLKTCVELKNAYHPEIIHGINSQLPKYIHDEGNRYGIFLVLWYKDKIFKKPSKFDRIQEFKEELIKHIPKRLTINVEIIDCTIKLPPSKKEKLPPTTAHTP